MSWTPADDLGEFSVLRGDIGGVGLLYEGGAIILLVSV